MNETKNIDLIELTRKMKEDAIQHARWMNDQYAEGDVERNHTNYGTMNDMGYGKGRHDGSLAPVPKMLEASDA